MRRSLAATSVTVVSGGTVVPGGGDGRIIQEGAVVLRGSRIVEVGAAAPLRERYSGAGVIDASGRLVLPGLINAHTHLYSALARGLVADIEPSASFVEILRHLWWRLDRALTLEDVRVSAAAGALDLVRNGTTTIVDHHASQMRVTDSLAHVAAALGEVGLRANLCFEITDRDGAERRDEGLAENDRFARGVAARGRATSVGDPGRDADANGGPGADVLLSASVGLHASFTLDDETLERASAMAAAHGIGCHVHVAEDRADVDDSLERSGKRVVERLHSFGVLGPKTVAAHCIHVDEHERSILKGTDTIVAHNPQSNMNNAVGCADVPGLLDDGILVGLGTDGFSASMLDEMKVANLVHRHQAGDPRVGHDVAERLCFVNNPVAATRLVGAEVGRLAPGALADLIVLDYDPPTPLLEGNFGGHVIFGLTGWMVETVIIGGTVVMRDREFETVDAAGIAAHARERARDLWKRM